MAAQLTNASRTRCSCAQARPYFSTFQQPDGSVPAVRCDTTQASAVLMRWVAARTALGVIYPRVAENNAAEVHAAELRIFQRKHVVVDGAEGRVRTVLHPFVERVDNLFLEVGRARMGCHHVATLLLSELVVGQPEN